jgi:hypothetical protein
MSPRMVKVCCAECRREGELSIFNGDEDSSPQISMDMSWTFVPDGEFPHWMKVRCPKCQAEWYRKRAMHMRSQARFHDPQGHPEELLDRLEMDLDYQYLLERQGNLNTFDEAVAKFVKAGGKFRPIHDKWRARATKEALAKARGK